MKKEGDEDFRIVDSKTTFRTKDQELYNRIKESFPEETAQTPQEPTTYYTLTVN